MKHGSSSTGFTLVVALLAALIPAPAHANHSGKDAESRNSPARFGPIGSISTKSLGDTASIDGRIAQGGDPIWGGELISAAGNRSVQIDLDSIGQVTLDRRSSVRLASASSANSRADVLIATLVTGSININLNAGARAYVEAGSSAFSASAGASFSVRLDSNGAALNTLAGEVRAQDPAPPQDVNIRIVDELGRPVSSGAQLSVRARSTRQVQVQVTDKNDKPLPDLAGSLLARRSLSRLARPGSGCWSHFQTEDRQTRHSVGPVDHGRGAMRRFNPGEGRGHQCIRQHSDQRSAKQGILEYTEYIACDCRGGSSGSDYRISRS